MKFFSQPATFAAIVAPLHDIHAQLQDLTDTHSNRIKDNEGAIAVLKAENDVFAKEQEQAAKVRTNIEALLAL